MIALLSLVLGALSFQEPASERLPFSVLYAGNPGTPYSAAWEKFLGEHATKVKFVGGSGLKREDLAGFDLLVIDGEVTVRGEQLSLKSEKVKLVLDDLQGFPVVLMGGQGGFVSDDLHLKTSWHAG
ncbi:MAG: hypothetical protein IPJ19_20560 [Planctomycetes bacterium]|nr:hypothetical protein [Planctomycetota bacterium]